MSETFTDAEISAGKQLFECSWRFVKGVVDLDGLPEADRPEIAFAGRSNVGKSSLINALVRQNGLARTSNTPGRTQELNVFQPDDASSLYLIDMPGYGFAKAPKQKVAAWTALILDYLRGRATLARVYVLIDARHGIKDIDRELLELLDIAAVSYQVILTKADKIKENAREALIADTTAELAKHAAAFPNVILTSSDTNAGIDELRAAIAMVLAQHTPSVASPR